MFSIAAVTLIKYISVIGTDMNTKSSLYARDLFSSALDVNDENQKHETEDYLVKSFEVNDWKFISSEKGVDVYTKKVPGSKLLAFRGVATISMHISDILRPFANLTLAYDWVDMLKYIESFDLDTNIALVTETKNVTEYFATRNGDIVHQFLQLPWPISPRELLMKRHWIIDHDSKSVTFKYHSVQDIRVPERRTVVRADSPHTLWRFTAASDDKDYDAISSSMANDESESNQRAAIIFDRHDVLKVNKVLRAFSLLGKFLSKFTKTMKHSLGRVFRSIISKISPRDESLCQNRPQGDGICSDRKASISSIQSKSKSTKIEIECLVDSKGIIPAWFLNYVQRSFPPKTIETFTKLAKREIGKGQNFPHVTNW